MINKNVKRASIIGAVIGLLFTTNVYAQKKPKYENVLSGILASEPVSAVAALKKYLDEQPTNPSILLQLGLIYDKRFRESDPLTEYKRAMANLSLAKEAYQLSSQLINEKEVKKNKAEYINFAIYDDRGKFSVPYDSIIGRMVASQAYLEKFELNVPDIYSDFTTSFKHYDKANKIFTKIVGRYKNLKELYLLYNPQLADEFDQLKQAYENSIKYFETYKQKTATYDIGYHQQLNIKDIRTYRLDGLSVEIQFLGDQVEIWNYSKWVDEIRAHINSEILNLRAKMLEHEKLIDDRLKQTKVDYDNNEFEGLKVDKEFLFILRKYDLQSVVEPIFLFKESKHMIMHQELVAESLDTLSLATVDRKLFLYGKMINNLKHADTVLNEIIRRNNELSYTKYKDFIDLHYTSMKGIQDYASIELTTNHAHFSEYIRRIQTHTFEKFEPDTVYADIKYKRLTIPSKIVEQPDSLNQGQYVTTHIAANLDGSRYVGGMFWHNKEKKIASFVLHQRANGKVNWMKEFLLQIDSVGADSHSRLAVLYAGQSGCTFIVNGTHLESGAHINTMFAYDEEGRKSLVRNLTLDDFPRTINFVERTNSFVVTFLDQAYAHDFNKASTLTIANINVLGDLLWQENESITGDINGIVITESDFLINGNYTAIKKADGTIDQVPDGSFYTYVLKVNHQGKLVDQLLLKGNKTFLTNKFFKSGDRCINIFGSTRLGLSKEHLDQDPTTLVHFIINKDLQVLSDSMAQSK